MTILSRILIMDVSLQTVLPCLISAYCQEERRIGPNISKDWQLRVDSIQAFNFMLGNHKYLVSRKTPQKDHKGPRG